jgi:protein-L-isoaspartate(D-aspartate) O-methyltransferase
MRAIFGIGRRGRTMTQPDWRLAADQMVRSQIEARGVRDPQTLAAMASVPRHRFIPPERRHLAYEDGAVPIGSGQTISQPFIVAQMTEALQLRPGDCVLEIGTGSGYQTAVLAEAVGPDGEVFTIERHPELSRQAEELLRDLGYPDIHFRVGDGTLGWPEAAPFDAIIVTAGGPTVPQDLSDQLDPVNGRLVIPVGSRTQQELLRFAYRNGQWIRESLGPVAFVPLIGEQGW